MRNLFILSSLAAFTAAGSFAQQQIPLNTIPSRVVGHAQTETTTIISTAPNLVEGRELRSPEGLALDTSVSPPILYIADSGNNRVLAWQNAVSFKNGQKADLVIGQQDMYHTNAQGPAGTFQTGLSLPTGLLVDSNGNLYVADTNNNRILRYAKPFAQFQQNGSVAPELWVGQPSLKTNAPNVNGVVDAQGLNLSGAPFTINMALDANNNLWVTDGGNRRVLRFPATQIAAGGGSQTADLVLGQVDFKSTNQPSPSSGNRTLANAFAFPTGIAFDSKGNLYVTDSSTDVSQVGRVLVFSPPFTIGQSAARIMGVPATPTTQDNVDRTFMELPAGVFFIPSASKMGAVDAFSSRLVLFDTIDKWPDPATAVSPVASAVYGQPDCHVRNLNSGTTFVPAPSESTLADPLAAVYFNNEVYVADTGNNRVVVLPVTTGTQNCAQAPGTVLGSATRLLGQDTFKMQQPNLIEGREFYFLTGTSSGSAVADAGVAVDNNSAVPHLYVADTYNNRVLGFKDFRSLTAGSKADLVLGQPDFSSGLCNITNNPNAMTAATLCRPAGLVVDANGDLYVADTGNNRVLRFPSPFAHQGTLEQADLVLGQHQFTFSITDPTSSTMSAPYGLAIAGSNGLLVSDAAHNRVLYFPFTANGTFAAGTDNGKVATKVFGQQDYSSTAAGSDAIGFNSPHGLSTDNESRLYVADSGNNRLMIFDHIFSSLSPNTGARADLPLGGFSQPRGVFVNLLTSEIWVGDTSNTVRKFPNYATLILNPTSTASVSSAGAALALTQDQYGDLIIADQTNRVGFYFPSLQGLNGGNQLLTRALSPGLFSILCSPSSACDPTKRLAIFGPNTANSGDLPSPFPLPTTLGDVQVLFNGAPTPLYYVSPSQINWVVPMSAPTSGTADVQVVQASTGRVFAAGSVAMAPYSPAILMTEYTGSLRQAAVINQDGTVNTPTTPAPRGTIISIYATGQGNIPNAPPDGTLVNGLFNASIPLRVNINGAYVDSMAYDSTSDIPQNQWLQYSGLNVFPGLWQINVYIPHAVVPNTKIPLVILGGGQTSTDPGTFNVYINVK
jgi:uncharacterized protein (TIGR03437 family)